MAIGLSLLGPLDTEENKVMMEREDMITSENSSNRYTSNGKTTWLSDSRS